MYERYSVRQGPAASTKASLLWQFGGMEETRTIRTEPHLTGDQKLPLPTGASGIDTNMHVSIDFKKCNVPTRRLTP